MSKLLKTILTFILILLAVLFVSPYWTLYQLKQAYDDKNYQAILSQVDFNSVQSGLKSQLQQKVHNFSTSKAGGGLVMLLGKDTLEKAGDELVNKGVEQVVTYDNLLKVANGDVNQETKIFVMSVAVIGGYIDVPEFVKDSLIIGTEQALQKQTDALKQDSKPTYGYCGVNCFYVEQNFGSPVRVVLSRHGLINWQINEIKLQ